MAVPSIEHIALGPCCENYVLLMSPFMRGRRTTRCKGKDLFCGFAAVFESGCAGRGAADSRILTDGMTNVQFGVYCHGN